MNLYLKIFLQTGIPFGICMGVFASDAESISDILAVSFLYCIFFGGTMAIFLGAFQKNAEAKIIENDEEFVEGVHQHATIKLDLNVHQAFNKCLDLLVAFKKSRIVYSNNESGKIKIKTKSSWKSWGEIITISLSGLGDDSTLAKIYSKPRLIGTIVDYGKNYKNVQKIKLLLTQ